MTESAIFLPPERNSSKSHLKSFEEYKLLYQESITAPESFWARMASDNISWFKPWDKVLEWEYQTPTIKWFVNGKLNVCFNCVDRHLKDNGEKVALIAEGNEPGISKTLTYNQLHTEVCKFANGLKKIGVRKGDRVAIYMPMIPEAAVAMLACARIGAVHSVIFAGFSAESVKGRVLDAQCKVIITANEALRGAKSFPLKKIIDEAIENVTCVEKVIVYKHTNASVACVEGRDVFLCDLLKDVSKECQCEEMDAEDPLFILYTSGSTGQPKGVLHTQGGYLTYAAVTFKYIFDYQDDDIFFCAADIGWVTGHTYVVYGPLANGATSVMFESMPQYPDAGRYWDICERLKVTIFYTAPTAIRSVARDGENLPAHYDLSRLRILGSVGEPINEDAWMWYYTKVGGEKCSLVDTWWQTETGAALIAPLAGVTPTKPGSATLPFFGIQPVVVDEQGKEIHGNDIRGRLCIKFPWPGQMRTVYGDHKRFFKTYFEQFPGLYFTGDACIRDKDGYYWITGRVDDVINVSGHRIGTAEVESALVHSGIIAEAAVIGVPHDVKGTAIYAFCILKDGCISQEDMMKVAKDSVRKNIGGFAQPDYIQFVPGLPRTRSGKIMRRILRKIACNEIDSIGDVSSLSDPLVVELIANDFKANFKKL